MESDLLLTIHNQLESINKELLHPGQTDAEEVPRQKKPKRNKNANRPQPKGGLSANQKQLKRALRSIQGMRL